MGSGARRTASVPADPGLPPPDPREVAVGVVVFAVALSCYFATLHPSVAGGDAGELMVVAHELGTPHPPGYPTFAMATHAAEVVVRAAVPTMSVAAAQNAFHALVSACAVTLLYATTVRATGDAAAGVLAALVFGFAPNVWTYAVVTEVFALNNLFIAGLLLLAVEYRRAVERGPPTIRRLATAAFVAGIALTNQHTSVLFVLPVVLWVFWRERLRLLHPAIVAAFMLGVSPYLYLPISASLVPSTNSWGAVSTVSGFLDHFLRREYGTLSLASKEATYRHYNFRRAWAFYAYDVAHQTLWCGWVFAVVGAAVVVRGAVSAVMKRQPVAAEAVFLLAWVVYTNFFNYLANLPIEKPLFYGVQQRFWIQPLIVVMVLAGSGFSWMMRRFRVPRAAALFMASAICAVQISVHWSQQDESQNYYVRNFGRALLAPLPPNSILLTKGDLQINAARSVQVLESFRPDVRILDQELLTYEWYNNAVRTLFSDVALPGVAYFPHRKGKYDMKQFLDANLRDSRRIFYAFGWKEGDATHLQHYNVRPFGACGEVMRARDYSNYKSNKTASARYSRELVVSLPNITSIHVAPRGKYPPTSWEVVILSDIKQHMTSVAFELMSNAERVTAVDVAVVGAVNRLGTNCSRTGARLALGNERLEDDWAIFCGLHVAKRMMEEVIATFDDVPKYVRRNLSVALQTMLKFDPSQVEWKKMFVGELKRHLDEIRGDAAYSRADRENVRRAVEHYEAELST